MACPHGRSQHLTRNARLVHVVPNDSSPTSSPEMLQQLWEGIPRVTVTKQGTTAQKGIDDTDLFL